MLLISYFAYPNHAVKHKKPLLIKISLCLEIPQKILTETIKDEAVMGRFEHGSRDFHPLLGLYAIVVPQDFQNY